MMTDLDKTISTTAKVTRAHRLGGRKLTRAHVALQRRPQLTEAGRTLANAAAAALSKQLGCAVDVEATLLDGTFSVDNLADPKQVVWVQVDLDACGASAVLEIERPALCAAVSRLSGGSVSTAPASRLTRIEEAAFGFLVLVALQAVRENALSEKMFAPRLRAANVRRDDIAGRWTGGSHLCVRIALRVGDVQGHARLFVPARSVQVAVQGEAVAAPGAVAVEVAAASVTLRSFIGRSQLDAAELSSLSVGDVVLFDGVRVADGRVHGEGRLSTRGFELFGRFDGEGFNLTRLFARVFPQESSMSSPIDHDETPALPVEVEIELTRLRMTVGELANIRTGSILPLHINSAEPVVLRVGDRAVARAELVEIEGEVGARILSLLS